MARCCGPSLAAASPLSISLLLEPIRTSPGGTTTSSGQFSHSLKTSLGRRPHSSGGDKLLAPDDNAATCAPAQPTDKRGSSLFCSLSGLGSPRTTAASRSGGLGSAAAFKRAASAALPASAALNCSAALDCSAALACSTALALSAAILASSV